MNLCLSLIYRAQNSKLIQGQRKCVQLEVLLWRGGNGGVFKLT